MKKFFLLVLFYNLLISAQIHLHNPIAGSKVKYNMDIKMDVVTNRFTGKQKLEYTNNSPDTLRRVFYHLYFMLFSPIV
jgi:hypothetical protein